MRTSSGEVVNWHVSSRQAHAAGTVPPGALPPPPCCPSTTPAPVSISSQSACSLMPSSAEACRVRAAPEAHPVRRRCSQAPLPTRPYPAFAHPPPAQAFAVSTTAAPEHTSTFALPASPHPCPQQPPRHTAGRCPAPPPLGCRRRRSTPQSRPPGGAHKGRAETALVSRRCRASCLHSFLQRPAPPAAPAPSATPQCLEAAGRAQRGAWPRRRAPPPTPFLQLAPAPRPRNTAAPPAGVCAEVGSGRPSRKLRFRALGGGQGVRGGAAARQALPRPPTCLVGCWNAGSAGSTTTCVSSAATWRRPASALFSSCACRVGWVERAGRQAASSSDGGSGWQGAGSSKRQQGSRHLDGRPPHHHNHSRPTPPPQPHPPTATHTSSRMNPSCPSVSASSTSSRACGRGARGSGCS